MDKEEKDDATLPLLPPSPLVCVHLSAEEEEETPRGGRKRVEKSGGGGENMWETPSVRPGVF